MRVTSCLTLALAVQLPAFVKAQTPEGWYPWPLVPQTEGAASNVSFLNAEVAGSRGFVSVKDGRFAFPDGTRLRLWGANLAADEAMPDAASAELTATTLAQAGVNIARLHHMDNVWGIKNKTSLWGETKDGHLEIDPAQLDKVHRLIAALKAKGIYSNINLKVSKTLSAADDFPESVSKFPEFQKRVDIYNRRMIDLQKVYARQLLTTVNPYTKLSPVNDPAVAIVEINNENSLLGYWTKNLGQGFERFPVEFREELIGLWNAWLNKHYTDDNALRAAWTPPAAKEAAPLVGPGYVWNSAIVPPGKAVYSLDKATGEMTLAIEKTSGIDWHAQIAANKLQLIEGEAYTIEFDVKTDTARQVPVLLGVDTESSPGEVWRELGFRDNIAGTTEWTHYQKSFLASSVGKALARLDFNLGQQTGSVSLRNIRLAQGSLAGGLRNGESTSSKTVPIPENPTRQQWADWISFLADTERAYADEIRTFLRDELGVKVPVACSQVDYGGLTGVNREIGSDFADSHAYWQHPDFGGAVDWNANRWTIKNSPQLADFGPRNFRELGYLGLYRVANKPYTISEYDHPAPSEFNSEMYPELTVFASLQDWDGIYPFCAGPFGTKDTDSRITSYFDQQHNPSKWAQSAFATLVFRRELISPATASATLHIGSPLWAEAHHATDHWSRHIPEGPYGFLDTRLAMSDVPLAPGALSKLERAGTASKSPASFLEGKYGRVLSVDAPAASALVGFLGDSTLTNTFLFANTGAFGRQFASLSAVSLNGSALATTPRLLVTLVGRSENQGMTWNDSRTSVGSAWGHGPTIVEFIPATVELAVSGPRAVFALAPDGSRAAKLPATWKEGRLSFKTNAAHPTVHFEVVAE